MAPAARTELDPAIVCRACGQGLEPGHAVCRACGAAHGEANRCPHCKAIADVEPDAALGFRCLVCGGPRVALDVPQVGPSSRTDDALKKAGQEQTRHVLFSAAGFALAGLGLLALLVITMVVLATSPGAFLSAAAYLAGAVPLAAGAMALARAAAARKLRGEALRNAQVSALGDVQAALGPLDALRVSQIMRVGAEHAELLLAEASVAAWLNEAPSPRLRVDAPARASLRAEDAAATELSELSEPRGRTVRGDTEISD